MTRILLGVGAVVLAVAIFCAGRLSVGINGESLGKEGGIGTHSTPTQARIERLPDDVWLYYTGASKDAGCVAIRRTDDMKLVKGISVFNGDSRLVCGFSVASGHLVSLNFVNDGRTIREWAFREDGSVMSEIFFEKDGRHATKTYYTTDGTKDREEKVVLRHGS